MQSRVNIPEALTSWVADYECRCWKFCQDAPRSRGRSRAVRRGWKRAGTWQTYPKERSSRRTARGGSSRERDSILTDCWSTVCQSDSRFRLWARRAGYRDRWWNAASPSWTWDENRATSCMIRSCNHLLAVCGAHRRRVCSCVSESTRPICAGWNVV